MTTETIQAQLDRPGHGINHHLVRALLARPDAWRLRTVADQMAIAV